MGKKRTPFDRVHAHLVLRGSCAPVTGKRREDLDVLVRNFDRVRSLAPEIELSPYMNSLLRVSDARAEALAAAPSVAAAGM
jgi:hypothetical protein